MPSRSSHFNKRPGASNSALTLVEVVVSLFISLLAISGIVSGYVFGLGSAERSALSLAAGAKALERTEEVRSAKWDTSSWPPIDQLLASNFPDVIVELDRSGTASGITYATNFTQISQVSLTPPLKRIHVDCVWNFRGNQLITNSVETLRAPDQ